MGRSSARYEQVLLVKRLNVRNERSKFLNFPRHVREVARWVAFLVRCMLGHSFSFANLEHRHCRILAVLLSFIMDASMPQNFTIDHVTSTHSRSVESFAKAHRRGPYPTRTDRTILLGLDPSSSRLSSSSQHSLSARRRSENHLRFTANLSPVLKSLVRVQICSFTT